jgi:hypothetical protein
MEPKFLFQRIDVFEGNKKSKRVVLMENEKIYSFLNLLKERIYYGNQGHRLMRFDI